MTTLEEDEETILQTPAEVDVEDEIQDWSQLSKLKNSATALPKRGEKDYEPDGTTVQVEQLKRSQDSMFAALEGPRGHVMKQNVRAIWIESARRGLIKKPKGSFLQTVGVVDNRNQCWLNVDEFVYLSERGTIEPWFDKKDTCMDLQSVYAQCFETDDEMDEYHVYAHLKRHGYIVMRHDPTKEDIKVNKKPLTSWISVIWYSVVKSTIVQRALALLRQLSLIGQPAFHPLHFFTSKYINASQIFNSIKLIPYNQLSPPLSPEDEIQITYDVWKPAPKFSKKSPPTPHFQIVVRNVNKYKFPTKSQLENLFEKAHTQEQVLKKEPNQMIKLKIGRENVVFAIVDYGIINFVRLSKGTFGEENMWYVPSLKHKGARK